MKEAIAAMPRPQIPSCTEDVLAIPQDQVPEVIRKLTETRGFSSLVHRINADVLSGNPQSRDMAQRALRHLGFVE